jgi:hypothetical protein
MAFGNPPTGMIADPERHARDSQLATCGTCRPLGGRRPSSLLFPLAIGFFFFFFGYPLL